MDFFFLLILLIESHDLRNLPPPPPLLFSIPSDSFVFQALFTWLACDKEDVIVIQLKLTQMNLVQMLLQMKLVKPPIQPLLSMLLLYLLHFSHKSPNHFQNQHQNDILQITNLKHQCHTNGLDYKHLYFI